MVDLLQNCHVSFLGGNNDIMGIRKVWNNGRKCLMNMFFVEDIGKTYTGRMLMYHLCTKSYTYTTIYEMLCYLLGKMMSKRHQGNCFQH